jgi:type I restriction enzyme S subunit
VALGDVCQINPPVTNRPTDRDIVSFLPMSEVSDDGTTGQGEDRSFGEVSKGYTLFQRDDVLVAKITPCFENGKIAQASPRTDVAAGSTEFHVVRATDRVDARYVLHYLRDPWIRMMGRRRMTGSGGQRRVPEVFLADLGLPLPPIEEQRRIAAMLDNADALRATRRESLALLALLTDSIFLDLFGDAAERYPAVSIESLAADIPHAIRTGPFGSDLLHSEFVDEGVAVLGIDNAVQNHFEWAKPRFITTEKFEKLRRFQVRPGDVLVTIMGTCGRTAVVPDDIPIAINTKHLCAITLDRDQCLPAYLWACFQFDRQLRHQLGATARGAVMPGLNSTLIKRSTVGLPPLELQRQFSNRLDEITGQRCHLERSAERLDDLFASLQYRAFRGDL